MIDNEKQIILDNMERIEIYTSTPKNTGGKIF